MPKLILSRKGLDSSSGGYPSPILEEKLLSIPIPQTHQGIPYNRIQTPVKRSVKSLGNELGMELPASCHLDPDLTYESLKLRPNGWKPCFGQHGAALTHLVNLWLSRSRGNDSSATYRFRPSLAYLSSPRQACQSLWKFEYHFYCQRFLFPRRGFAWSGHV